MQFGVLSVAICGTIVSTVSTSQLFAQNQVASQESAVTEPATALARTVTVRLDNVSLEAAIKALASKSGVRIQYRRQLLTAVTTPVTVHASGVPLSTALAHVLRGTSLVAVALAPDFITIKPAMEVNGPQDGVISGTVVATNPQRPLQGVMVYLDDRTQGVRTDASGAYRITGVPAGEHRVSARLIGYAKSTKTVTVAAGGPGAITVDFALETHSTPLDQVVVTGTVVPTEQKSVPNAITVITAKQIEERGITHIEQLFRGDVPGLFATNQGGHAAFGQVVMFSRGATALSSGSEGVSEFALTNAIKTYVDGVELADPQYLSQIDPKSIERIEIIAGPQASTIYGSNAVNGVMQVFTKRGTSSQPQLNLSLLSGWVENNFSPARTPQHDVNAQLSGNANQFSYNGGGSWSYLGPWTPSRQSTSTGSFGGVRLDVATAVGRATADASFRRSMTRTNKRGSETQLGTSFRQSGWFRVSDATGLASPTTDDIKGQTMGVTFGYAPVPWWSSELKLGDDVSTTDDYLTPGYLRQGDTATSFGESRNERRSIGYTSTLRVPLTSLAQATITAGADNWQGLYSFNAVFTSTPLNNNTWNSGSILRATSHNTGTFLQTQLDLKDKVHLTYGLRAEWNPAYGKSVLPSYAPRYGISYVQDVGDVTAKLRASYGRSTRPPLADKKLPLSIAALYGGFWPIIASTFLPYYGGVFNYNLANPDLGPEHQQGSEGGLELYWGNHGSLTVTRYNQTVDGLIAQTTVDSVRTLVPCPSDCSSNTIDANGFGYYRQYAYLNIGAIRNQGWELQGTMNTGPLTTRATYSWTKSRVLGITPKYRQFFANFPQFQPGATFKYLPEHTWAFGVTYAHLGTSIGLAVTGTARVTMYDNSRFYYRNINPDIRLLQNRQLVSSSQYINFNPGYTMADLNATRQLGGRVDAVLQVQNLADKYVNDYSAEFATMGRQMKGGFRCRF